MNLKLNKSPVLDPKNLILILSSKKVGAGTDIFCCMIMNEGRSYNYSHVSGTNMRSIGCSTHLKYTCLVNSYLNVII